MNEKKKAINISIRMIVLSLVVIGLCWRKRTDGLPEILYVLSSGVFGSSFATLWIFIYEYNKAKLELFRSLLDEVTSIFENETLPVLERWGFYAPEIETYMTGKYYMPPVHADVFAQMSSQEKCLYMLCRFVDGILETGYGRIHHICDLVSSIAFWSDSFRCGSSKYKKAVERHISFPLYEVFIAAPAMEDGYIFRYFKGFKTTFDYSADEIYQFVCELDQALHGTGSEVKYGWQERAANLGVHMHEKMWIFRDAFFSPELPFRRRCRAKRAFLKDKPYECIR